MTDEQLHEIDDDEELYKADQRDISNSERKKERLSADIGCLSRSFFVSYGVFVAAVVAVGLFVSLISTTWAFSHFFLCMTTR